MKNAKTLTKVGIEKMANEIIENLQKKEMDTDVSIFFNNRQVSFNYFDKTTYKEIVPHKVVIIDEVDPHDYFKYAAFNHILSMSFEGRFYEVIYNDGFPHWFTRILTKYGVCCELGNQWNLTCFPIDDSMKVEYTFYEKPKKIIRLHKGEFKSIEEYSFQLVMNKWEEFAKNVGDIGSCVLGAGFSFEYNENQYFLPPPNAFQGSISWETNKDDIENMLKEMGCKNINYHWGNMD